MALQHISQAVHGSRRFISRLLIALGRPRHLGPTHLTLRYYWSCFTSNQNKRSLGDKSVTPPCLVVEPSLRPTTSPNHRLLPASNKQYTSPPRRPLIYCMQSNSSHCQTPTTTGILFMSTQTASHHNRCLTRAKLGTQQWRIVHIHYGTSSHYFPLTLS